MEKLQDIARGIELLILDVDGVLTDGFLYLGNDGNEYKVFNTKDGHGIRMLHEEGFKTAILTARTSKVVAERAADLGIEFVMQGQRQKRVAYEALLQQTGFKPEQVAYVGDDVIDLPVMSQVALPIAVADAHPFVKQHARWVTQNVGGRGAVREVCELMLAARGILQEKLESYL